MSATAEAAVEAPEAEVVTSAAPLELRHQEKQKLLPTDLAREVEAEIFLEASQQMRDTLRWQEWDPTDLVEQQKTFDRWVQEFGGDDKALEKAKRLRNLVRAVWLGKKDAPRAVDVAQAVYVVGVKKRATESQPREIGRAHV